MSGLPDLAKIGKNTQQKKFEAYQTKVKTVCAKILDLMIAEGIETHGEVSDVIATLDKSTKVMMYQTPFVKDDEPKTE